MKEFIKLVGASFGWAKDFTSDVGIRYYEFLKLAAWVSAITCLAAIGLLSLSQIFDLVLFNFIGVLVLSGLTVFWIVAAQPVFVLGEQLVKIEPIRRITQRVGAAVLIAFVVTLYTLSVPAGTEGTARVGVLLILLVGAFLAGFQLTKRTVVIKLIIVGSLFAAAIYFPQTTSIVPAFREVVDRWIGNRVMPRSHELEISLANLAGQVSNPPRLFLKDEPLWWCRLAADRVAGFRCFDQSGKDEITNEQLFPISQEIVLEMIERLTAAELRLQADQAKQTSDDQEKKRQAQLKHEQEQAVETLRAEAKRLQDLEVDRIAYIRRYISVGNNAVDVALGFKQGNTLNRRMSQELGGLLTITYNAQLLNDMAVSDGVFDSLFRGDVSEATKLRLSQVTGRLVLGTLKVDFTDSKTSDRLVNAKVSLDARMLDTTTGAVIDGWHREVTAPGFSQFEAQKTAEDQLVSMIAEWIEDSRAVGRPDPPSDSKP